MTVRPRWTWRRDRATQVDLETWLYPGPKPARACSARIWSSYGGVPTRMVRDGPRTKTGQGMLWPVLVIILWRTHQNGPGWSQDQNRPGHALAGFGPGTMPDHFGDIFGLSKYVYVGHGPPHPPHGPSPPKYWRNGRRKQEKNKLNKQTATKGGTRLVPKSALRLGPTSRLQTKIPMHKNKSGFSPCVEPPLLQPPLFGFLNICHKLEF